MHLGEVIDEGLLAISYQRVVLNVLIAHVQINGLGGLAKVGHAVEVDRG